MENEDGKMTMDEFNKKYTTLENLADGNCMFMSVAQLLEGDSFTHDQLRDQVCEFHKNFVADPSDYPPDSFLQDLAISLQVTDPSDYYHKDRICNNFEYANFGDILILSHLLDRPFIVFINDADDTTIYIKRCNSQSNQPPIRLRYYYVDEETKKEKGGGDHYEAVLLKSESPNRPSPNTRRSSPKPTKKSSTRKASPKLKKSPKKPSPKPKKSPKKPSPKKPSPKKPSPKKASPKKPSPKPKKSPKKTSPKPKKAVSKKASPKPKPKSSTKKASISNFIKKHPLLGKRVEKKFDGAILPDPGTVASYNHPFYRIVYDDGDEEDLSVEETEEIIKRN